MSAFHPLRTLATQPGRFTANVWKGWKADIRAAAFSDCMWPLPDIDHIEIRDGKPVLLVANDQIPRPAADFDRKNITSKSIPIIEERLEVGKREVEGGKVRIRTRVVEQPVSKTVELRDERIDVDRRAVNERVGDKEASAMFKDQDIELTERSEKVVAGKETRVKEELVVSKETGSHKETVKDTVRHTEVDVDRDPGKRR